MRIAAGIATMGRPAILSETLREIGRQRRLPDLVIVCPAGPGSIDTSVFAELPYETRIVSSAAGLTRQRNAILAAAAELDAIVFLDDDFFPAPSYLANAEMLLRREADVVMATGVLIEDGIVGPGLSVEHARARLAEAPEPDSGGACWIDYGCYGCNMVLRLAPALANGVRFDEVLPLYAWQEDIDFSRQMSAFGRIVRSGALSGVHLGTKGGRTSGFKFGYSQVANPVYLIRKGTVSPSFAGRTMAKNLAANVVRTFRPEAHIDRRGRLRGNLLALADLMRGRLHPRRILEFS